jgi:hypothetical protein
VLENQILAHQFAVFDGGASVPLQFGSVLCAISLSGRADKIGPHKKALQMDRSGEFGISEQQ